jgi:PAS domain S-box-containing protein
LLGKDEEILLPEAEKNNPQHEMMWDAIKKGQYFSGEFKRKSKQGKEIWMNGTYNPISDINNEPYKVVKFASFVTEAKEMELDLNGKLSALKNSVGVIEMNPDFTFASVNQLLLDVLGYKRLEIRKGTLEMFVGADQFLSDDMTSVRTQVNTGKFQQRMLRFFKKDKPNEELHYQCTFSPINNLSGNVVKIMVIMIDVTPSVLNERKIKAELKDALENSNMIRISDTTKDTEGMLKDLNDVLHEMNQGALDIEAMLSADKVPMIIFDQKSMQVEKVNGKVEKLFGKGKGEIEGINFFKVFELFPEEQKTFSKGIDDLNVFNLNLITSENYGAVPAGAIFTPLLGESYNDTKYCLIITSL